MNHSRLTYSQRRWNAKSQIFKAQVVRHSITIWSDQDIPQKIEHLKIRPAILNQYYSINENIIFIFFYRWDISTFYLCI